VGELARRVDEGTLDQYRVMEILQHTIEGEMPGLLSSGGLVLTKLESVAIEVGPRIREELSKLDKSFPCHKSGKGQLKVGTLHYVRFSDQDETPGTKRILRDMEDNGVRAGTASELLATIRLSTSLVNSWGEYVVALGSATNKGGNLRRTMPGFVDVAESARSAPWWPSCYSFFVVKDV
jgi:hypothetical protein